MSKNKIKSADHKNKITSQSLSQGHDPQSETDLSNGDGKGKVNKPTKK